jgi:excisionase family DNA binding protein
MNTMTTDDERFLSVQEVAVRLRVSPATIYRLVSSRQIPAIQLAGANSTIRISAAELAAWLVDDRDAAA